jgi:N-acetylneuraminate synthase
MTRKITIGSRAVGDGEPNFIIAEIGINHNGDLNIAKRLIDAAVLAGCDAVKFQKRTPELCVPPEQRDLLRETPWGTMTYLDYRYHVEFGQEQYDAIDAYCKERAILWFASVWDKPSLDFMEQYAPVAYKIPSASLTDSELIEYVAATGRPMMLSTGMSTPDQIRSAVKLVNMAQLLLAHCTSAYPCPPSELNLRVIQTMQQEYPCPQGYSQSA